jgi:predicted DNA-binding protein YlxM (UPF0122 family)
MKLNKEEFNQLEVLEQIKYVNELLNQSMSLTAISERLSIGRTTLRDRFKKHNHIFSKQQNKYMYNDCNTGVNDYVKVKKTKQDIDITELKYNNNVNNTGVILIDDKAIQSNLIDIAKEYNTLIEMIELYKKNSTILTNQIVIDLEDDDSTLTSFRVNSKVLKAFNEFADERKEYKKMHLLSMALKEYMKNHS